MMPVRRRKDCRLRQWLGSAILLGALAALFPLGLPAWSGPAPDAADGELPGIRWLPLQKDMAGARRGSALRYAPAAGAFFLWGFMNSDYGLLQESPTAPVPEHDMVAFDPADGRWRSHLPRAWEAEWGRRLPPVFIPRTYAGITSGSEDRKSVV